MLWYFPPPLLEGTGGVTRGLSSQPLQVIVNQVISHCSPCLHLSCLQHQLPATWILIRGTYITFVIIIALHYIVSVSSSEIMLQGKEKEKSWQSQCLNSTEVCCWFVSWFSASQMAFLGSVSRVAGPVHLRAQLSSQGTLGRQHIIFYLQVWMWCTPFWPEPRQNPYPTRKKPWGTVSFFLCA